MSTSETPETSTTENTTDPVLVHDQEGVRILTINRPKAMNALNLPTLDALFHAVNEIKNDRRIGVVLLTGRGSKAFVAGADISQMSSFDPDQAGLFAQRGHDVMRLLEEIPQPVIAAVNGFALGGGTELALSCDFIYASNTATFGQPEVKLGLIPGFGGTQRLLRKIPAGLARELIYTGDMLSAEEAHRIGLVNKLFEPEELMEQSLKIARKILKRSDLAVAQAKHVMREGQDLPMPEACAKEVEAFSRLFATDHPKEGTEAFLAKRPAQFSKD